MLWIVMRGVHKQIKRSWKGKAPGCRTPFPSVCTSTCTSSTRRAEAGTPSSSPSLFQVAPLTYIQQERAGKCRLKCICRWDAAGCCDEKAFKLFAVDDVCASDIRHLPFLLPLSRIRPPALSISVSLYLASSYTALPFRSIFILPPPTLATPEKGKKEWPVCVRSRCCLATWPVYVYVALFLVSNLLKIPQWTLLVAKGICQLPFPFCFHSR